MSQRFVVVCLTQTMPEAFVQNLKKIFLDFSAVLEKSHSTKHSIHFHLSFEAPPQEAFKISLIDLSWLHQIDIGCVPVELFETKKKLVIFDMDSTLITAEVIDEMAIKHGVGEKVKIITARAMNGELNFDESLKERVSLLKGFNRKHMETIVNELTFTPGVPEFLQALKAIGIKTAIASGGFEYFARSVQARLRIDYVFANNLEFEGDHLTGKLLGPIVNAETKERIVQELAKKENLTLDQVVAIGDGANDIPMLLKAGLGIAIHAKEKVQKAANYRINFGPMTRALSLMNDETL